MLGFFAALLVFSSGATAAEPSATPAPIEEVPVASDLSNRLNTLHLNKDCIRNAKTRGDIEKCRGSIQIKRERK